MIGIHRQVGKFKSRTADESQVSVLLKDFDDADKMLAKIIDATKAWRDSWVSILGTQFQLVNEFHTMYAPIIGANDAHSGPEPASTPQSTMERTSRLREAYNEMKTDLLEEVNMVDTRITKPAMDAKDFLQPLKKVIKKREDKKLDFELYQGRVDSGRKKIKRSDRENASLAKAEMDLATAADEYQTADARLKSDLPPLISAAFSILPHLLAAQIMTQNTLLGQYYTILHNYCQDEHFPSPPPPMNEVIAAWDADFKPLQRELESINCIAGGKAVRQPMKLEDQIHGSTVTGLNIRNGYAHRRASHQPPARPSTSPSIGAGAPASPEQSSKPKTSGPSTSSSALLSPPVNSNPLSSSPNEFHTSGAHSPAAPRTDYFSRDRVPSNTSTSSISMSSVAAAKKKPPPPPVKRLPSNQGLYVTALYDFDGQNDGDLSFREGDRIKVTKKTASSMDWWKGELRGVEGSFPANYCQVV